jgi:hypothetical protein
MNEILFKCSIAAVAVCIGALVSNTTVAGGISLYEVGDLTPFFSTSDNLNFMGSGFPTRVRCA